jgi:predicted ArsR family transcriptional regulator
MKITSRQKVFREIHKHRFITVSEISQYLDLTPANIRHHLSILMDEGLVEKKDLHRNFGRGRPESVYTLSRVFKEDGLAQLTDGILRIWASSLSVEELIAKLDKMAALMSAYPQRIENESGTKRLFLCVEHLNLYHYQASWEAGSSGPHIRLGNCPYWKIIERHPELCTMDKILLEKLSGFTLSQISKLEQDEKGELECLFIGS